MQEKLVWFQKEYWYKSDLLKTMGFAKTEIEAPLVLKHTQKPNFLISNAR